MRTKEEYQRMLKEALEYLEKRLPKTALYLREIRIVAVPEDCFAYTDGEIIYLGKKFWKMSKAKKAGILAHEFLHIVWRHIERAEAVSKAEGDSNWLAFNLAQDSLINDRLNAVDPKFKLKNWGKTLKKLGIKEDWRKMLSEEIYEKIKDKIGKNAKKMKIPYDLRRGGSFGMDINPGRDLERNTQDDAGVEIRGEINVSASTYGKISGSSECSGKESSVWKNLEKELLKCVKYEKRRSFLREHRRVPEMMGTIRRHKRAKTVIGIDCSGSTAMEVLGDFAATINRVLERLHGKVDPILIFWSTEAKVMSVKRIPNEIPIGGGTTIKCLFNELKKIGEIDLLIVLTDGIVAESDEEVAGMVKDVKKRCKRAILVTSYRVCGGEECWDGVYFI